MDKSATAEVVKNEMPPAGVHWTPLYLAFLAYVVVITTGRIPLGTWAVAAALFFLVVQRDRFRFPPFLSWLVAFLLWGSVGYATSAFPETVADTLQEIFKICLITLVAVNALRTLAQIRVCMLLSLVCFAVYPVRGTIFNYLNDIVTTGRVAWNYIYSNPNDLAALTLLQISIGCAVFVSERALWLRMAAFVAVPVMGLVVSITASRGGMLGLFAFIATWWLGQKQKLRGLAILAVVGIVAAVAAPNQVWERLVGLKYAGNQENLQEVDPDGSAYQRFEILKVALSLAADHPLMGVGMGVYPLAHYFRAQESRFDPTARGYRDTHNTYLNLLVETGVVGLGLFAGIFVPTVLRVERTRRRLRSTLPSAARQLFFLELGLLAFFASGFFGTYSRLTFVYVHLALLWATAEAATARVSATGPEKL